MNTPLNGWVDANPIPETMLWRAAAYAQINFVRDDIVGLVGAGLPWRSRQSLVTVVAEHRSKSIVLPVYRLQLPNVDFHLRHNFFNWKLSVMADDPIDVDLTGLCHTNPPIEPDYTGNPLNPVYFEGFPREVVFGYYEQNRARWSAEFRSDYDLWAALFLVMRSLSAIQPCKWHTRESHRAELDAERSQSKEEL